MQCVKHKACKELSKIKPSSLSTILSNLSLPILFSLYTKRPLCSYIITKYAISISYANIYIVWLTSSLLSLIVLFTVNYPLTFSVPVSAIHLLRRKPVHCFIISYFCIELNPPKLKDALWWNNSNMTREMSSWWWRCLKSIGLRWSFKLLIYWLNLSIQNGKTLIQ